MSTLSSGCINDYKLSEIDSGTMTWEGNCFDLDFSDPERLDIEIYGSTYDHLTVPMEWTGNAYEFSVERYRFKIEGSLGSYSSSSASVTLSKINWAGVDLCSTGTYTFDAEQ